MGPCPPCFGRVGEGHTPQSSAQNNAFAVGRLPVATKFVKGAASRSTHHQRVSDYTTTNSLKGLSTGLAYWCDCDVMS